jgi:hypothetical protein
VYEIREIRNPLTKRHFLFFLKHSQAVIERLTTSRPRMPKNLHKTAVTARKVLSKVSGIVPTFLPKSNSGDE